jgi:hypothetical protein
MSLDIDTVKNIYRVNDYYLSENQKQLENGLCQVETVIITGNTKLSGLLDFIDSLLIDSVEIIHIKNQEIFESKTSWRTQVQFTICFYKGDWESLGIRPINITTDKNGYRFLTWGLNEKYENISIYAKKLNTDNF